MVNNILPKRAIWELIDPQILMLWILIWSLDLDSWSLLYYFMSKMSWPIFKSKLLYKMGQYFLHLQHIADLTSKQRQRDRVKDKLHDEPFKSLFGIKISCSQFNYSHSYTSVFQTVPRLFTTETAHKLQERIQD